MNLQECLQDYKNLKEYRLKLNGTYIWDYKLEGLSTVYLIKEDPTEADIRDRVQLGEIIEYVKFIGVDITANYFQFKEEFTRDTVLSYSVDTNNKEIVMTTYMGTL